MEKNDSVPRFFITKVGYETWGGNEFYESCLIRAQSEKEALEELYNRVQGYNRCKQITWATCKKNLN
jgi:hypothetical protein